MRERACVCVAGMFLSMSMEEPNEPLACNVDGGRQRAGSSRSNDDSSVSMPESGSSAGSEHNDAPPNGHMATMPELHPQNPSQIKRRAVSPVDDPRRPKRPKHGTSSMLLTLMQVSWPIRSVCLLVSLLPFAKLFRPLSSSPSSLYNPPSCHAIID